ncbi:MAG: hypothetical protein ACYC5O_22205 [Anaerolineae bacterium]
MPTSDVAVWTSRMSEMGRPRLEQPAGRVPISLIIDDPAPYINPLHRYLLHVNRQGYSDHAETIRDSFIEDFADFVQSSQVRGKFTVLPYPDGLGPVTRGWEGYSRQQLDRWLATVRDRIMPAFDITPEILTHTLALDIATGRLMGEAEQRWMDVQSEDTLTRYIAYGLQLLQEVGLRPHGITQPVTFRGDEMAYAHAIRRALDERGVGGVGYYFLWEYPKAAHVAPEVMLLDRRLGKALVSVSTGTEDVWWHTQPAEARRAGLSEPISPFAAADTLLTENGASGRLADLLASKSYAIFHSHWQSLYSDGSGAGLTGLAELVRRVDHSLGERVVWMRMDELATYHAAVHSARVWMEEAGASLKLHLDVPFQCAGLTLSLQVPPGMPRGLTLTAGPTGGAEQRPVPGPLTALQPRREGWAWRQDALWLQIDAVPGESVVTIRA